MRSTFSVPPRPDECDLIPDFLLELQEDFVSNCSTTLDGVLRRLWVCAQCSVRGLAERLVREEGQEVIVINCAATQVQPMAGIELQERLTVLYLPLLDSPDQLLPFVLVEELHRYTLANAGCTLIFHCVEGKSRSVSMAIAYLMCWGMPFADALAHLQATRVIPGLELAGGRFFAEPNPGFLAQLEAFTPGTGMCPIHPENCALENGFCMECASKHSTARAANAAHTASTRCHFGCDSTIVMCCRYQDDETRDVTTVFCCASCAAMCDLMPL